VKQNSKIGQMFSLILIVFLSLSAWAGPDGGTGPKPETIEGAEKAKPGSDNANETKEATPDGSGAKLESAKADLPDPISPTLENKDSAASPVIEKKKPSSSPFGIWSLLPAFLAIVLALWTKQVLISLLGGIWSGALLQHGFVLSLPRSLDVLVETAADADKLKVILFTLALGGMVGIVSASGGTKGIVRLVARYAKDAKSSSVATWIMGMAVFFDDYASTLLTGSTMRPITDKARISREKLSYIVDSTAAPIASIALVSTWIGYEVSVLGEAMKASGLPGDPYQIFIQGIPSRFYPIFALLFVFMVAIRGRDFGPMYHAEKRARSTGRVLRDGASPLMDTTVDEEKTDGAEKQPVATFAVAPILVLIASILICLKILGPDASYDALLYGSAIGLLTAGVLPWGMRRMRLSEVVDSMTNGIRSTTLAIMVLVLAWSVGKVMNDLQAGPYVAGLLGEALPAFLLPTVTFLLAAVMALATGTSWGTMAILFPIVIPVVALHQGIPDFQAIFLGTSSAVLAGAVFGDHCSPISDTTVLSSIASGADHVDHVRTQLPYAMVCGGVSIFWGTLPMGFGLSPWLGMVMGILSLWLILQFVGKDTSS
jgi:Na+/H+ antiporter NhaC